VGVCVCVCVCVCEESTDVYRERGKKVANVRELCACV